MCISANKWIYFVKEECIENDIYRFYFKLSSKRLEKLDLIFSDSKKEILEDVNIFYIDVQSRFIRSSVDNNICSKSAKGLVLFKLQELCRKSQIPYENFIKDNLVIENDFPSTPLEETEIEVAANTYISHRYWHMQLHPDDSMWAGERELLIEKGLIGLSDNINNDSTLSLFCDEMQIGDLVLIRRGSLPIALVMVTSKAEFSKTRGKLDWFDWRRKIKLLTFCENRYPDYVAPRGTLKRSVDIASLTYRYIDDCYKKYIQLITNDEKVFVSSLSVHAYKRLKDFTINFNNNGATQNLIVLAGINGSGKTSILDIIESLFSSPETIKKFGITARLENINGKFEIRAGTPEWSNYIQRITKHVVYIKAGIDTDQNIYDAIQQYIDNKIRFEDARLSEAKSALEQIISESMDGLDVSFRFTDVERQTIIFTNNEGTQITFDELSTGERTLITKLLVLNLQTNNLSGKIVLIDEPEISLHPTWQSKVLKLYKTIANKSNCQIIIATHSPHIISSTPTDSLRILREDGGKITCYTTDYGYGQDFQNILLGIMGIEATRDPETLDNLRLLSCLLHEKGAESQEFIALYNNLREQLGEYDTDLNLIALEAEGNKLTC